MSVALGIILSFTAALAWGTGMVVFKVGVKNIDPLTATYVKGLLAVPILLIIGLIIYPPSSLAQPFLGENLLWLILSAIFIALGDFFSLFSLKKIEVSISQPITAIYPFVTILLLVITGTENISWEIIVGAILIAIGVATITFFSRNNNKMKKEIEENVRNEDGKESSETKNQKSFILGIILALTAAVFWGGTIFFTRKLLEGTDVEVIPMMGVRNGIMVVVALAFALISSLVKNKGFKIPKNIHFKELAILMGGGVISWCIGGVSFFTVIGNMWIDTAISTPLSSISPFFVLLLGSIILKEKIRLPQVIGVAIIVGGSILLSFTTG